MNDSRGFKILHHTIKKTLKSEPGCPKEGGGLVCLVKDNNTKWNSGLSTEPGFPEENSGPGLSDKVPSTLNTRSFDYS